MAIITIDVARNHALFHLATKASDFFSVSLDRISIGEGIEFYDPVYIQSDDPPLYVFEILLLDGVVAGNILIASSTFLGSTLISISKSEAVNILSNRQDLCKILRQEAELSDAQLPDSAIHNIVYSYPKYGVGIKNNLGEWVVVDWKSKSIISSSHDEDDTIQGALVWSFWDEFPQAGPMEEGWNNENNFISNIGGDYLFSEGLYSEDLAEINERAKERKPIKMTTFLPVNIEGQITNVHCAPASLSMIYSYIYHSELDQNEAGEAMNMLPMGSTISGQVRGFKQLLGSDFDIEIDRTPTWEELKVLIEEGLPVKSGIRGHARVATGVRKEIYMNPITGAVEYEDKLLLINDPEPVGIGAQTWENVKTAMLRDFIFVKRKN